MSSASLQLGGDNWAAKDGNLLGYQRSSSSSVHIPHEFTFTRGSNLAATRVAANGLIEKGRENLAKNTNWEGASLDTAPTNYTGYLLSNGTFNTTSTEGQIRFTTDSSSRAIVITSTISETGIFTQSVYVDEVYTSIAVIDIINRSANATAIAYYEDGVEITATTNVQAGKRYSILWNKTGAASFRFGSGVNTGKAGDIVLSRPQIEQGLVATELIVSPVGSTGLAGLLEDEPRIDYTGGTASLLLEPSRTNLITNSEYIDNSTDWTVPLVNVIIEKNSITSPERQTNATKLTGSGGSAQRRIYQSFSQLSGQNFTASIFAKEDTENILFLRLYNTTDNVYANASFNLSTGAINSNDSGTAKIENYGNGWYRCILTGTPSTTTTTGGAYFNLTDDGNTTSTTSLYLWGAQVEQASYATSYIPTYGTSVTRNADGFQKTGASGVIGQTEGTLYIEAIFKEEGNLSQWFSLTDGTANNWVFIGKDNDDIRGYIRANNIVAFSNQTFQITNNTVVKAALSYKSGSISLYINGSLIASSTNSFSFNQPLDTIYSTTYNNQDAREKVDLDRMLIFKTALTNAECISLTTL